MATNTTFACAIMTLPARQDRVLHSRTELSRKARSSCRSVIFMDAFGPTSTEVQTALQGPHASHLQHFKPTTAALLVSKNATLTRLLADGSNFPLILFEDDVILHPDFEGLLQRGWSTRPARAEVLQLGLEGHGHCAPDGSMLQLTPASTDWKVGFGLSNVAVAFTRRGAELYLKVLNAPSWPTGGKIHLSHRYKAEGHAPLSADESLPIVNGRPWAFCDRVADRCSKYMHTDLWFENMASLLQPPEQVVHWAARDPWPLRHRKALRHETAGGMPQCGLAVQGSLGSDISSKSPHTHPAYNPAGGLRGVVANLNFQGADLGRDHTAQTAEDCYWICARTPACAAFTFITANIGPQKARCWLKSKAFPSGAQHSAGTASGVVARADKDISQRCGLQPSCLFLPSPLLYVPDMVARLALGDTEIGATRRPVCAGSSALRLSQQHPRSPLRSRGKKSLLCLTRRLWGYAMGSRLR